MTAHPVAIFFARPLVVEFHRAFASSSDSRVRLYECSGMEVATLNGFNSDTSPNRADSCQPTTNDSTMTARRAKASLRCHLPAR